jgi:site-specific DNA recombinase
MRNVVAYCRSACETQRGPSAVHRQARALRQYAKERGLAIRSIYLDPGVSGSSLDRPELQRLIADCHAGKIGTVITQDPARLSRDTRQLLALLNIFRKTGVRVEFGTPEGRTRLASLKVYLPALLEIEEAKARFEPQHS